jgi:chemotaxis protein CheY-P-specific phosphatase CheC
MATKSKPTDVTGRMREQLQDQAIEAQQEAANKMSMATAQAKVDLETNVIDATKPNRATVIVDEVITVGSTKEDEVEIRVVQDLENMTLGHGNTYNFKAGQKYKVKQHVAQHLKEKGYLAGVI